MKKKKLNKLHIQFTIGGTVIGIIYLLIALFFELSNEDLSFTFSNIALVHQHNNLLYIADSLPLVLFGISYFIGLIVSSNFSYALKTAEKERRKTVKLIDFAGKLSEGNTDVEYQFDDEDDILGKALVNLKDNLKQSKEEEIKRKKIEDQENWVTEGLAKFGEILRQNNDDMEKLSFEVISNLGKYIDAIQGGFFVLNEIESEKYFELSSHFAYNRKKYSEKRIEWGEGLVGRVALEKKIIYMNEVPDDYVDVTSGLGEGNPRYLLIVPLIFNEEVHGVIEFASFNDFKEYVIDFVEKIGESIASTIANMKINLRTAKLLQDSQEQAEKLAIQEEEMRQNMEELQATQEEAAKQSEKFVSFTNSVNHTLIRAEYNVQGILLYANTKFLHKLEYTQNNEVEGQHISTFIHTKDIDWFNDMWGELSRGGKHFEGYMKHVTKSGKDLWTMSTYTCVRTAEGGVEKILFLAIDNTEQKKISLDHEGQLNAIDLSSMKAEYDPNGILINSNKKFQECLEYGKMDLRNISIFDLMPDTDREDFKIIWESIANGKPYQGQAKRLTKSNKEVWLQVTYTAVYDIYGELDKIVSIANDITAQKMMEIKNKEQTEILIQQEERLKQNEIELNIKLEETRKEIEQQFKEIEKVKVLNEKTLEGALDAIVTIDNSGKILFFNKAAEELWDLQKENVLSRNVRVLFSKDKSKHDDFITSFIDSSKPKIVGIRKEVKIATRGGEEKSVLVLLSEAKAEGEHTFTAFIQNIEVELF
ncbi:MAG: PAS domain S-box protein [Chlorobi bacterium]|nr:PAS domain S-box protein [Chlorobiota bacterium]